VTKTESLDNQPNDSLLCSGCSCGFVYLVLDQTICFVTSSASISGAFFVMSTAFEIASVTPWTFYRTFSSAIVI
jgi:hypothetical protein